MIDVLRKIKRLLVIARLYIKFAIKLINTRKQDRIYVLSIPYHGNLGDQAIAYAQVEYLKSIEPHGAIIEIYMPDVKFFLKIIQRVIKPHEKICIHGGGNMGNQYKIEEETRRKIIKAFPHNPIVSFPETIYFTKDQEGMKELKLTEKIYNQHGSLTIVGREKISYECMKKSFPNNNVILTPDIVLYLNKQDITLERKNIFVCLRSDVEGIISQEVKADLINRIKENYQAVEIGDTVVKRDIKNEDREVELEKIWNQFRQSKVVVTDRLHGMIFAAITGTPCVVLNNYNHKVAGEYEWIKGLDHIRLLNKVDTEDILHEVNELYEYSNQAIKCIDLRGEFQALTKVIQDKILY